MRLIKKFESYKSREEMCDYLCNVCGYNMNELESKSDSEIQEICDEMKMMMSESMNNREEMCDYLCNVCGYNVNELESKSDSEIQEICDEMKMMMSESKSENWIKKSIKKPGSLRSIDLKKSRKLNLKNLKENHESNNYMFFANLQTIKRLVDGMLEMEESKVDSILSDGHGWALDHIATSKDDVEEVFNFLASHDEKDDHEDIHHQHRVMSNEYTEPSHEETEGNLDNKDLESEMKGIKSFNDFEK